MYEESALNFCHVPKRFGYKRNLSYKRSLIYSLVFTHKYCDMTVKQIEILEPKYLSSNVSSHLTCKINIGV
jgi:hypothetical protein